MDTLKSTSSDSAGNVIFVTNSVEICAFWSGPKMKAAFSAPVGCSSSAAVWNGDYPSTQISTINGRTTPNSHDLTLLRHRSKEQNCDCNSCELRRHYKISYKKVEYYRYILLYAVWRRNLSGVSTER